MLSQKVREHVPPAFDGRPVLRMFVDPGHMDFYAQVAFPDFGGSYPMPLPTASETPISTIYGRFDGFPHTYWFHAGPRSTSRGGLFLTRSAVWNLL
jgi:hypothetical protein